MVWVLCELNVWHQYVWLHLSTVGYLNTLGSEGMRITVLFDAKPITKRCLNTGIRIRRIPNKCILSPDVEYLILIHVHESLMVVVVEKSHLRITNPLFKRKLLTLRPPPHPSFHTSVALTKRNISAAVKDTSTM